MTLPVSLVITVRDEVASIDALCASIAAQTAPPAEVLVVDGGSTDGTLDRLAAWRERLPLRVIALPGANISQGRNAGIAAARHDSIAVTDAGVRLDPGWLATLLAPLHDPAVEVASGFFLPDPRTPFEIAMGATVLPEAREIVPARFLPSSRSIAFRRAAWARVGGYPAWLDYCEDLVFDLRLRASGTRFVFVPEAVVYFRPRGDYASFWRQYFHYARGDGKAGLFARRHLIRYATYTGLTWFLGWGRRRPLLWPLVAFAALAYLRRPYQRLFPYLPSLSPRERLVAASHVPLIRLVGDGAKLAGYPVGLLWRWRRYGPRRTWRDIAGN